MDNVGLAFLLSTIAGLSTLIGTIFLFFKKNNDNLLISSLSFAAGVMITISIFDLVPEGIKLLLNDFYLTPTILISMIFVVIGIIISMTIDKYLPEQNGYNNECLYRVGIISMLAIIIHNIPEGIATFLSTNNNINLGISLTIAIALHNIPEGISISVPIYYATGSKLKAILFTLISGLSEPFGAIVAYLFLKPFINDTFMGILFSIIAGIMLHISFYELLPTSLKYKKYKRSIIFFIIGIIFIFITII